jgi:hypothetical protein
MKCPRCSAVLVLWYTNCYRCPFYNSNENYCYYNISINNNIERFSIDLDHEYFFYIKDNTTFISWWNVRIRDDEEVDLGFRINPSITIEQLKKYLVLI